MQGFARATEFIPSQVAFTTTGNIDNLDFSGANLIRMNNASDATIRGLVAGTPGQVVTIVSIGAGNVYFAHQNANSTEANRLINFVTGANTPLAAGIGTASYQYDGTTARWRLIAHEQGKLIDFTFSAGDFTATAGTWTVASGDVRNFGYYLSGRTVLILFTLVSTSVSANPATLLWDGLPTGLEPLLTSQNVTQVLDNGSKTSGIMAVIASSGQFQFERLDAATWAISSDLTFVGGSTQYQIA